jgi:hypothetical protein
MITATLFRDYLDMLKDAATDDGITATVMLGYPEEGRPMPSLPVLALAFAGDGAQRSGQNVRLGETRPHGTEVTATLMLIATDEYQLLQLIDFLRGIKEAALGMVVGSDTFAINYDQTRRVLFGMSDLLHHAAETAVSFRKQVK